jgi:AcrR family transcriptional regulator
MATLDKVRAPSTQQRILREAAALFAVNGYHGTSTRDIAREVGIRQPSLFHHFTSKQDIADRLFEIDLTRSVAAATALAAAEGPAAVRLYQYLRYELEVTETSPYDLRGLYLTDLIDQPEFARWRAEYDRVLVVLRELTVEGIESGEFVDEAPELVVTVLDAVITHSVIPATRPVPDTPERVASLLLRMLLRRPSDLRRVVRAPAAVPLPPPGP